MYCHKCGAKNPDDAAYCLRCGAKLRKDSGKRESETDEHFAVNSDFVEEQRQRSDGRSFAILCLFFGAASVMLGFTVGAAIPFLVPAFAILMGIISQKKSHWRSVPAWIGLGLSAAGIVIQCLSLMK